MKHVVCFGMLYEMTDKKYVKMLEDVAAGKGKDLCAYGKMVGDVLNVTDLSQEEAADKVAWIKAKTGTKYFKEAA